jgi:hypothetical protein
MTQSDIDPNELAAFLDGRLGEKDRERIIRRLAEDPEFYDLFVETAEGLYPESHRDHVTAWERDEQQIDDTLRSLDRDERVPAVAVSGTRRSWWRPRRWALRYIPAAAAAILAIVLFRPRGDARLSADALAVSVLDYPNATRQYASAIDTPGWSVSRGVSTGLTAEQQAFRLGVRLVDLAVAVEQSDSLRIGTVSAEMESLLEQVELSEAASVLIQTIARQGHRGEANDSLATLVDMTNHQLRQMLDSQPYELGLWCGAARLAAPDGNVPFFTSKSSRRVLSRTPRSLSADALDAWRMMEALVSNGLTPSDLAEMNRLLSVVVKNLGGL